LVHFPIVGANGNILRRFDEEIILFTQLLLHVSPSHKFTSCSWSFLSFQNRFQRSQPLGIPYYTLLSFIRILTIGCNWTRYVIFKAPYLFLVRVSRKCNFLSFLDIKWLHFARWISVYFESLMMNPAWTISEFSVLLTDPLWISVRHTNIQVALGHKFTFRDL
jgi:hypothetical protein